MEWIEEENQRIFFLGGGGKHCIITAAFITKLEQMEENSYCFICHVSQCCQRNFRSALKFSFSFDFPLQLTCF